MRGMLLWYERDQFLLQKWQLLLHKWTHHILIMRDLPVSIEDFVMAQPSNNIIFLYHNI